MSTFAENARAFLPATLAVSIALSSMPAAFAGPGDVNSTNDGEIIQEGTYFNTPGSRTTFVNSSGGGLHLRSGDLVRGLESNANKVPTGNGGTLYFRAPGSVVRLDGTIDVSAVKNGTIYTGNGGKVFVDSSYLFQNGNVFANGVNGGLVQFNVGGMTLGPEAKISTMGFGGNGGAVDINSPGAVDLRAGSVIDSSGKVIGTFDTNIINIEGSVVNNDGIIRANGFTTTDFKADNSDAAIMAANPQLANNPAPGTITGGTGTGTIMGSPQEFSPPGPPSNRGGTVRLIASGQTNDTDSVIQDSTLLSSAEKTSLLNRSANLRNRDGFVVNNGQLLANGAASEDGGTIMVGAADSINNFGIIFADGGNGVIQEGRSTDGGDGGMIIMSAMNNINAHGFMQAMGGQGGRAMQIGLTTGNNGTDTLVNTNIAGDGGDGGMIALSAKTFDVRNTIRANGGMGGTGAHAALTHSVTASNPGEDAHAEAHVTAGDGGNGGAGGLIVFSGDSNPTGAGEIQANGGQGGRGGNTTAGAWAIAQDTGGGQATVLTETNNGVSGAGGATGTVAVPNAGQFPIGYRAQAGGLGTGGTNFHSHITRQNGTTTVDNQFEGATPGTRTTGPHNALAQTQRNEILRHKENAVLFSQAGGPGSNQTTLSGRINNAIIRTVDNPLGLNANRLDTVKHAANFWLAGTNPNPLTNDIANSNVDPVFTNLTTLTMLNNGNIDNNMHWAPGLHLVGPGFHDVTLSLGGGHTSMIGTGDIQNDGFLLSRGLWTGGSINLAAGRDIINNNVMLNIAFNKHTSSGYTREPGYISSHSGSTILLALRNIVNNDKLNDLAGFSEIHPPLAGQAWLHTLNAGQIGSTVHLLAGNNITNASGAKIGAETITYRDTTVDNGAQNPANGFGGIIHMKAGGTIANNGVISTDAQSWQGSTGNFKFSSFAGLTQLSSTDGDIIEEEDE